MTDWVDLERELDGWGRAGQSATFWWRDDDAVTATPALQRLLDLAAAGRWTAAAAGSRGDTGAGRCRRSHRRCTPPIMLLHCNTAMPMRTTRRRGQRRPSLAWVATLRWPLQELRDGAQRMRELFGDRALPVLVPPWNRIDPALTGRLAELGIRGLSTYGPRAAKTTAGGAIVVNTHVDIINWHDGRRFLGIEGCLRLAIDHLAARREGRVDPDEPTGLLTHHLVHDEDAWAFLAAFLQRTSRHPAVALDGCPPAIRLQQ